MAAKCRSVTLHAVHVPQHESEQSARHSIDRPGRTTTRRSPPIARVDGVFLRGDVVDCPTNLQHPSELRAWLGLASLALAPRMRFSHVTTALCRTNPISSDRKAVTGNAIDGRTRSSPKASFAVDCGSSEIDYSVAQSTTTATVHTTTSTTSVTDLRFLQAWKTTTETGEADAGGGSDAHGRAGGRARAVWRFGGRQSEWRLIDGRSNVQIAQFTARRGVREGRP